MYLLNSLLRLRSIFCSAILLLFLASLPLQAATITTSNGFESGLGGLRCSGNCPSIVKSPTAGGKQSGNFTLTRNMPTPYRTEAVLGNKGKFEFGKEYWFAFKYRYEDWATDASAEFAPFQVHTTPSSWASRCSLGAAYSTAPFFMQSKNGKARFVTYRGKTLWAGSIQKQRWLTIAVHFRISKGGDGFIEAWKDGVKLGKVTGANSPKSDKCGKPMRAPFFKMGVYKWDWKKGRNRSKTTRRQLFIDNLKIATGSNGLALVGSSGRSAEASSTPANSTPSSSTPASLTPSSSTPNKNTSGKTISAISGNRYAGRLVNGALLTNEGVEFDGIDDYLDVGKQDVAGNAMTITGWFLADRLSNCRARACRIISKATGNAEKDHYFMVSTIAVGSKTRLRFRLKTNGVTSTLIANSGTVQEDKWVHVAAVYDGTTMRLYQNGVKVGSASKKGRITPNSGAPVWVGGNPRNAKSRPWKGWIDDFRIDNYALTEAKIAELAKN